MPQHLAMRAWYRFALVGPELVKMHRPAVRVPLTGRVMLESLLREPSDAAGAVGRKRR